MHEKIQHMAHSLVGPSKKIKAYNFLSTTNAPVPTIFCCPSIMHSKKYSSFRLLIQSNRSFHFASSISPTVVSTRSTSRKPAW